MMQNKVIKTVEDFKKWFLSYDPIITRPLIDRQV